LKQLQLLIELGCSKLSEEEIEISQALLMKYGFLTEENTVTPKGAYVLLNLSQEFEKMKRGFV
jgi:hypothetical protein